MKDLKVKYKKNIIIIFILFREREGDGESGKKKETGNLLINVIFFFNANI